MELKKAALMANFSKIAYSDQQSCRDQLINLGYGEFAWFDNEGTQAFACRKSNANDIFIVFRGTEPNQMKDILADVKAWRKPAREKGLIHFGFAQAIDKVYDNIVHWINEQKLDGERNITCTGHSLGAALATIMASRLDANELYTFGSPRIGNRAFVKEMNNDGIKHYRFVNNNDIVTKVPFPIRFVHHGELVYINHFGNIRKMSPWQRFKDQWRGRMRALSKGQPFDGIFDHSVDLYYQKVENVFIQSPK
ncbi:lipase family protein [bacterium]|nr:lipase family protein [bacterium]